MNYYIADLHFGHANAISFDNRPFASVEEMNEALIRNWNARIAPEDTVYVLGDIFFKYKQSNAAIMAKLNGHKHLIKGNHDWGKILEEPWESAQPYLEIVDENRRVILCHFPIPFYNRARRGSIMLYGHVHSSIDWELLEKWKQECQELGASLQHDQCGLHDALYEVHPPNSGGDPGSESGLAGITGGTAR